MKKKKIVKKTVDEIIKDTVFLAVQATKQENSGLIGHVNSKMEELKSHLGSQDTDMLLFRQEFKTHTKADEEFQDRMSPFLKAMENKRIAKMVINEETSTITIYVKRFLTVGAFATLIWQIIKFIFVRT